LKFIFPRLKERDFFLGIFWVLDLDLKDFWSPGVGDAKGMILAIKLNLSYFVQSNLALQQQPEDRVLWESLEQKLLRKFI
jgi:hypothetical protein